MNPTQRVALLREVLHDRAGATSEDLHARLCEDHRDLRLATVKSTLHAFQEYFACDESGGWHIRYHRHAVA